ncbi:MAG: AAA family ATPase [Corynebacterium flavescens]|uniref:AAA family ATPase n=1 Tax=Corynebacterium flavescens TaxID=28028 RepID=UPI003F918FCC
MSRLTPREQARLDGVPEKELRWYSDSNDEAEQEQFVESRRPALKAVPAQQEIAVVEDNSSTLPRIWKASDLAPSKPVKWMAHHRVPLGNVTVLVGDEGIGKSLSWVLLVAALTTGRGLPTAGIPAGKPRHVLLFLAENGWADMDRPRLEVAGADLDYVHVIASNEDGTGAGTFSTHIQHLIEDMPDKPALIVADPWLDTVPGNLNVKDGQQAKMALRPWRELAVKHNAGVLLVAHTNRIASASARDKYGATAELRKTARMTLYAQLDDETGYLAVGPEKSNLVPSGAKADLYRFNAVTPPGFTDTVPYLEYVGQSEFTASELIEQKAATASEAGKPETGDAKDLILDFLKMNNGTSPVSAIKEYWDAQCLKRPTWRTIQNSRRKWGIDSLQTADGWEWFISDPDHE